MSTNFEVSILFVDKEITPISLSLSISPAELLSPPSSCPSLSLSIEARKDTNRHKGGCKLPKPCIEGAAVIDKELGLVICLSGTKDFKPRKLDAPPDMLSSSHYSQLKGNDSKMGQLPLCKFIWGTSAVLVSTDDPNNKRIVLVGGATINFAESRVEVLDISFDEKSNTWGPTDIRSGWRVLNRLPEGRHSVSTAIVPGYIEGLSPPESTKLLVIGGRIGPKSVGKSLLSVLSRDIADLDNPDASWVLSPSPSEDSRQKPAVIVLGDYVLLIGGARDAAPLNKVEIYDSCRDSFVRGPSLNVARQGALAFFVHGEEDSQIGGIVVVGGSNNNTKRGIEAIEYWDFNTFEWTVVGHLDKSLITSDIVLDMGGSNPTLSQLQNFECLLSTREMCSEGPIEVESSSKLRCLSSMSSSKSLGRAFSKSASLLTPNSGRKSPNYPTLDQYPTMDTLPGEIISNSFDNSSGSRFTDPASKIDEKEDMGKLKDFEGYSHNSNRFTDPMKFLHDS